MKVQMQFFVGLALLCNFQSAISYTLPSRMYTNEISSRSTICRRFLPSRMTFFQHDVIDNKHRTRGSGLLLSKLKTSRINRQKNSAMYDLQLTALIRYKDLHGHLLVPSKFVVPDQSSLWPREMWKLQLGHFVANVRSKKTYRHKSEELTRLGFEYEPVGSGSKKYGYEMVKRALLKYKELNGDMLIQALFVVPRTFDWPTEMWGMKLGFISSNVRRGSSYAEKRAELLEIGFDFESQHKYGYDLILAGLVRYKELNGNLDVPSRFQVPSNHADWSSDLWTMKLGVVAHDIRRGRYAEKKEEFLSMGFKYVIRRKFDYECVKIAVYKYRELNYGSTKISNVYNIPENDPWYPEETWGMCLGSYAKRIKNGSLWPDKYYDLFG